MLRVTSWGSLDEQIKYVTVTHVRKYRGRYPKYMQQGGMSRGASYFYEGTGKNQVQTSIIELSWQAN